MRPARVDSRRCRGRHCLAVACFHGGPAFGGDGRMQIGLPHRVGAPLQDAVRAASESTHSPIRSSSETEVDAVPTGQAVQRIVTAVSGVPATSICRWSAPRIARQIRDGLAADVSRPSRRETWTSTSHDIYEAIMEARHGVVDLYAKPWLETLAEAGDDRQPADRPSSARVESARLERQRPRHGADLAQASSRCHWRRAFSVRSMPTSPVTN